MIYVICEQQKRRSACASEQSDQRLCCSLLKYNFKTLASFCGCTDRFVSGLVGNSRKHVLTCRGLILKQTHRRSPDDAICEVMYCIRTLFSSSGLTDCMLFLLRPISTLAWIIDIRKIVINYTVMRNMVMINE